ncbi:sorting nexin-11 isoform X2 [Dunckerocampus dactyliophorus]|uniref:sorting nexin-11 isoform X2 n=1 Tax=Dunckerocampus dactyliophorus TaxID=161453 RepID=UPI00240765E7|nr:sorting nexin-11 isoform X2 [Dunckerocampus dactyliophorus]
MEEFVAVRVQDPRVQNEGSWNSYVDYKIFLHTNSKAFTAKTSCVRRRYSEFVWLKRKLQKNAGLVPVPDLPGKSFFSFSNEDFLERRRHGLQVFLDKVVNMTVCLSDSQLHLFLQTQLPVGHILDCVQGHTPYTVTDAILTYASSNRGWAQAQEEDAVKEPSLTVSYESMESPAPHQPRPHDSASGLEFFSSPRLDPLADILEPRDATNRKCKKVLLPNDVLDGAVDDDDEDGGPTDATFYLGDSQDIRTTEGTPLTSGPMEAPVEVHSPAEDGVLLEAEPAASGGQMEQQSSEDVDSASSAPTDSEEERAEVVSACDRVRSDDPAKEERHEDEHRQDMGSEEEEDSSSLSSCNESIVKVSDEEHISDDATDLIQPPNGFVKMSSPEDADPWSPVSGGTMLALHVNGAADQDELSFVTRELSNSLDVNFTGGDLSENNDFSVLESSSAPELAGRRHSGQGTPSSLAADATYKTAEDI